MFGRPDDRDARGAELRLRQLGHLLLGEVLGLDRYRRLRLRRRREVIDDEVGQVAGVAAVLRADRDGRIEAESVELDRIGLAGGVVALVDDEDHGGLGSTQPIGDLVVERRKSGMGVDREQDQVRFLDGDPCLVLHPLLDVGARVELQPTGVDHGEGAAVPLGRAVDAVAGRARDVGDDGQPLADEPVEERALPDVRAADDRDHGE